MKWTLLFLLGLVCGSGVPATVPPLLIQWTGNGNPGVPNCTTKNAGCVSGFTITGAGTLVNLPATAKSYLAKNGNGKYFIKTNGYSSSGKAISSAYEQVPVH